MKRNDKNKRFIQKCIVKLEGAGMDMLRRLRKFLATIIKQDNLMFIIIEMQV
jgi:hypothetical protein